MKRLFVCVLVACGPNRVVDTPSPEMVDASIVDSATIVDVAVLPATDATVPTDAAALVDASIAPLDPAIENAMRAQLRLLPMHDVAPTQPAPKLAPPPVFKGGEGRSYATHAPLADLYRSKPARISGNYPFFRIEDRIQHASRCFDMEVQANIHAKGEVVIDYAIDTDGRAHFVQIKGPLSDGPIACLEQWVAQRPYEPPPPALMHVVYTVSYLHLPQPTDP
jgi:hypothetical protein